MLTLILCWLLLMYKKDLYYDGIPIVLLTFILDLFLTLVLIDYLN